LGLRKLRLRHVRGGIFPAGGGRCVRSNGNKPWRAKCIFERIKRRPGASFDFCSGHRTQLLIRHPLSSRLERFRHELIAYGQHLQTTAPFQGRSFFSEPLTELFRLTCRIAVIGQVKAGKSSFINAFTGKPGLLPTDINPWTTAVTHLHFGCHDAAPDVAAQFTFFAPNEWEQLTHGGGRIRELTQRLVPGFEVELLEKRIDQLRRRSQERLGSALADLLGRRHRFPTLSSEILARYVCSGAPGKAEQQAGIYSDIVKTADLYFTNSDFGLPTTVIDTPATNDPFLVREITRRALEEADIYIVMLTARQALSSADIALLRILRGLHKDRIAVFINRIDELSDVLGDTPIVVQHVRTGLHREFPVPDIPIAGSAFWANLAITGSDHDIVRVLSTKVKSYAGRLEQLEQQVRTNAPEELPRETLLRCSGLPALSHVMAGLTLNSRASHVLRQARSSFAELAQVGRNAILQAITIVEAEERATLSGQH
jgi:Dynamin family